MHLELCCLLDELVKNRLVPICAPVHARVPFWHRDVGEKKLNASCFIERFCVQIWLLRGLINPIVRPELPVPTEEKASCTMFTSNSKAALQGA